MGGRRGNLGVVPAAALVLALAGCTAGGDGYAASLAERVAVAIGDDITPAYPQPLDAEYLAAWAIESPRLPSVEPEVDYAVEVLDWNGNSGDAAGATLIVRVDVHVLPHSATSIGGATYSEGRAVRCWQLTVFGFHDYDSLEQREIECPAGAEARQPNPAPLPTFPSDVDARLTAAIEGATAETIEARVLAAFPEDYYSVAAEARAGELVVALGIPSQLECAIGVVGADGSAQVVRGFDRESLQPGEIGCSPALYLR